jgi:uncharacterized protein YndB with AHSA1/START domain
VAIVSTRINASRNAVFGVLSDGWKYSNWVVGTSHMRAVGDAWPAVGSKLYHASGAWPLVTRDETEVTAAEPDRKLAMIARGGPLGTADISIELEDDGAGCRVTMHETPSSGPGRWLHGRASEALLVRRNTEALARLAAVAERRSSPAD